MTAFKKLFLAGAALLATLLAGLRQAAGIARSERRNRKTENIVKLDKSVRQAFSSRCLRVGSFKPSEP